MNYLQKLLKINAKKLDFISILILSLLYKLKHTDMKNGRINERNTGNCKLDGGVKIRKQSNKITDEEKYLAKQVLSKIVTAMEYDKVMSNGKGHLNNDAIFTDGGRITLSMTREQYEKLTDLTSKL